jgi:hypothetical protein
MVPAPRTQYIAVGVEAPIGALLPRPLIKPTPLESLEIEPWWQALLQSLQVR